MTLAELNELPASFVPPSVAAPLLGCDQYSLNISARRAVQEGSGTIGCIRFFFAGRNLRLCKADILSACGWTK